MAKKKEKNWEEVEFLEDSFHTYIVHETNGSEIKIQARYFMIEDKIAYFYGETNPDELVATFSSWAKIIRVGHVVIEKEDKADNSVYSEPVKSRRSFN